MASSLTSTNPAERPQAIRRLRRAFEAELFERVLPFWEKHSLDRAHGGYVTCLDRDGAAYDTTKYSWMLGRQVWMFSRLYRDVEARADWLDIARLGVDFLREHAIRPDGRVFFSLTADGRPVYQQRKIFSECFYVIALAEYARAAEQPSLLQEAEDELGRIMEWAYDWSKVGRPAHEGQDDAQSLAVPMILLNVIEVVAEDDPAAYRAEVDDCIERVQRHVHTASQTVYETVRPDGARIDSPEGRLLNPGHAIEAGWFLQHWAQRLERDDLSTQAADMVRWSFDRGWDDAHDGLFYFLDAEGYSPVQLEWSMKLWWPHCEALYAHLLNYSLSERDEDWHAFMTTYEYTFDHFPDPAYGEWYGYLNRRGEVTHRFKGGPYKGCFHVPRTLWLCWRLLQTMEDAP